MTDSEQVRASAYSGIPSASSRRTEGLHPAGEVERHLHEQARQNMAAKIQVMRVYARRSTGCRRQPVRSPVSAPTR